jgi:hypothetical protein
LFSIGTPTTADPFGVGNDIHTVAGDAVVEGVLEERSASMADVRVPAVPRGTRSRSGQLSGCRPRITVKLAQRCVLRVSWLGSAVATGRRHSQIRGHSTQ